MRPFSQVDVFTTGLCTGNPLAVVADADGLTDEQMRAFARWTNLSETAYLLSPTDPSADYRIRIFTPSRELSFAGHPTLGGAHVWLAQGGTPATPGVLVQQCATGLVRVRADGPTLAFATPPLQRSGPLPGKVLHMARRCLGVAPSDVVAHSWGVIGPQWAMLQLADVAVLREIRPETWHLRSLDVGVVALTPAGTPHACEVRAFIEPPSPPEDPVTGSLNAALAQWLRGRGVVPERYLVRQGTQVGADGEVSVHDDGTDIWIGGRVSTLISGQIAL